MDKEREGTKGILKEDKENSRYVDDSPSDFQEYRMKGTKLTRRRRGRNRKHSPLEDSEPDSDESDHDVEVEPVGTARIRIDGKGVVVKRRDSSEFQEYGTQFGSKGSKGQQREGDEQFEVREHGGAADPQCRL